MTMNKLAEPFDVRANVSEAEWQARVDLAACYRLVDHHRWTDMLATHISARVPGEPEHFLINPFGQLFGEITASSLLKVDEDGNILLPSPYPFNAAGFVIHGAIHEARPEVNCVLHLHTADGIAVSAQEEGLLPLSQIALACLPKISYHEYEGVALNMDERKRLVSDLGSKDLMILRNHGTLSCGTSMAEAWVNIYALERSCSIQVRAMTGKLHKASQAAIDTVAQQMQATAQNSVAGGKQAGGQQRDMSYSERAWPAMLRLLDRIDPGYKN
jgi:ribulose-5-phosphate 4-epimerase/fuculose-1-phosphate aldolase